MYKELLDAMLLSATQSFPLSDSKNNNAILPTETPFSFSVVFAHLDLKSEKPFSDDFVQQSRAVILGNRLRFGASEARTLGEMTCVWQGYVLALGLGSPTPPSIPARSPSRAKVKTPREDKQGRTEDGLVLVYRRAGQAKVKKEKESKADDVEEDKERKSAVRLATEASLNSLVSASERDNSPERIYDAGQGSEDDELALAVEMSLGGTSGEISSLSEAGQAVIRTSQNIGDSTTPTRRSTSPRATTSTPSSSPSPEPAIKAKANTSSGSIIGRHRFTHSPRLLAAHLSSVLAWWLGDREPVGVSVAETGRCGWCEFEEKCEWR